MSVTAAWGRGASAYSVLVHGGAGDVPRERIPLHVEGCRDAARAAASVLAQGGSALDAVQCAVEVLEDNPLFNAGTGACLTADGCLELDASIMEGTALKAGAVCTLSPFKNPIQIARAVLEDGKHIFYAGQGADAFAEQHGFLRAEASSMITEAARKKLAQALESGQVVGWAGSTVGAVARDEQGRVAAATSTGGMVGKLPGRVGDTPVLGAGTYADDGAGAASATGHGEGILRVVLTAQAVESLRTQSDAELVARSTIERLAERVGSTGGVILVGRDGRLAWARSTHTMTWSAAWQGGQEAGA